MGPSGSGKTTCSESDRRLRSTSEGEIQCGRRTDQQHERSGLAHWRTRHVGFVFQFSTCCWCSTAYENVELPLLLVPMTKAERRRQVTMLLDLRVAVGPDAASAGAAFRRPAASASHRARAIVTDPTLIVADEPTGDLDTKSAHDILDLMVELKTHLTKTILMVTHDPAGRPRAPSASCIWRRGNSWARRHRTRSRCWLCRSAGNWRRSLGWRCSINS